MMQSALYIDDAGTGNILGGAVFAGLFDGIYRKRIVGPEWFELGSALKPIVSSIVIELILTLKSERGRTPQKVVMCRSDIFNHAAKDATRLGFTVERACIEGELQTRAEDDFVEHLIEIGLPRSSAAFREKHADDKTRYYRTLNEFSVSYIMAHPCERLRWAKPNCGTYEELKHACVERNFCERMRGRRRRCVECGESIVQRAYKCSCVGRIFYVHERCAKWAS